MGRAGDDEDERSKTAKIKPNMLITVVLGLIMAVALGTFISRIMEYNDLKRKRKYCREIEACERD